MPRRKKMGLMEKAKGIGVYGDTYGIAKSKFDVDLVDMIPMTIEHKTQEISVV